MRPDGLRNPDLWRIQACLRAWDPTAECIVVRRSFGSSGNQVQLHVHADQRGRFSVTATYNLAANTPAGWSAAINPATVTLAAGASASITVNVTSPAGAADQQYGLDLVATNAADSTKTAVASVACTVSTVLTASVATDRALYRREHRGRQGSRKALSSNLGHSLFRTRTGKRASTTGTRLPPPRYGRLRPFASCSCAAIRSSGWGSG